MMTGPITVAMLNRKGGCGKTSTCHHLAGAFAKDGLGASSWSTWTRRRR